ncbi:hypothetical protein MMC07_006175 [Pseudocyphellaria aurata]|nr:hypothetical protein [Pseudocyphellaria aurata]
MRLPVFPTAILLTHGISVLGGPLSVRKEIRDLAQGSAWMGSNTLPFLTLNTQPDIATPEFPSNPNTPVTETSFVPSSDALDPFVPSSDTVGNIYAALGAASSPGAGQPDTREFQSGVSTVPTSPTNLDIPQLFASSSGSDSSLISFGGSVTNTQLDNESPDIRSSFQIAMKFPETLEKDLRKLIRGDLIWCNYVLTADKQSLRWNYCGGQDGGWYEFKNMELGFVLYKAPNQRILSFMNVVNDGHHKQFDNDGGFTWVVNDNSLWGQIKSDIGYLQRFKKEWVKKVTTYLPKPWTLRSEDFIGNERDFMYECLRYFEKIPKFCDDCSGCWND